MKKNRLLKSSLWFATAFALITFPLYADYVGQFLKANITLGSASGGATTTTFGSSNRNNNVTVNGTLSITGAVTGLGTINFEGVNGETITNPIDGTIIATYDDDAATLGTWTFYNANTSTEDGNNYVVSFIGVDSASALTTFLTFTATFTDVTDGTEDSDFTISGYRAGSVVTLWGSSNNGLITDQDTISSTASTFSINTDAAGVVIASGTGAVSLPGTSHEYQFTDAKLGTTAGWATRGANNIWHTTCPAGQSASTLVIPVELRVGQTITAFKVVGQIESAGNTVTLDADLRKVTTAAGDLVDSSVGAITQISVTADTAVATTKSSLSDTVAATETFYVLLTATTGASTDIDLQGVTVTVVEN